jgi:protein TonB
MYLEGLIGFIDRYGNSTFTERDLLQIKGSYEDLFENEENLVPLLETWPEFPGGPDSLNAYLAKTIQYPQDARDNGISGTVLAEFSVEKDGQVGQVTIKVPLFPSCNEEVVRVLQQMPKWKPGTNQGLPVRCFMQVPVTFRGDKEADEDK